MLKENQEKKYIIIRTNYKNEETGEYAFTEEEERLMSEEEFWILVKRLSGVNYGGFGGALLDPLEFDYEDGYINYTEE